MKHGIHVSYGIFAFIEASGAAMPMGGGGPLSGTPPSHGNNPMHGSQAAPRVPSSAGYPAFQQAVVRDQYAY